jgi:hypothetical protein
VDVVDHSYDVFHKATDISAALATRMEAIADEVAFPVRLTVEEAEEVIRILWEFCGHLGEDVGAQGYEFNLLQRARHWAQQTQIAMLAAMVYAGPRMIELAATHRDREGGA